MPATHNWAIFDRIAIRVMLGIDIVKYVPPHVNISIGFGTFTSPNACGLPWVGIPIGLSDRSATEDWYESSDNVGDAAGIDLGWRFGAMLVCQLGCG